MTAPLGLASLQLLPGSPFLRELAEMPLPDGRRGRVDRRRSATGWRRWPARCSTGVRHISLPTGHSGLLVDEEVADVVVGILRLTAGAVRVPAAGVARLFEC